MPQEPWKRASQLQRAVPREARKPSAPPPRRRVPYVTLTLLLVFAVAAAGMWFYKGEDIFGLFGKSRGVVKPSQAFPKLSTQARKLPQVSAGELDEGLGIGLVIDGDYPTVLDRTRGRNIPWKQSASGNTLRLSAPGVTVYADGKRITAYTLKLGEIYTSTEWIWWQDELQANGLSDKATPQDVGGYVAGQSADASRVTQTSLYGTRTIRLAHGWANPAFELDFKHGLLSEVHAGIRPGVGEAQSPVGR